MKKHSSSSLVVTLDHTQLRQVQSHMWPNVIKKIMNLDFKFELSTEVVKGRNTYFQKHVPKIIPAKKKTSPGFLTEGFFFVFLHQAFTLVFY